MLQCRDGRLRGIIPACAGNTSRPNAEPESWRDHPRVCGEHDTRGIRRLHNSGSSPRVRGTRCAPSKPVHLTGIIPACAGNTKRTRPWPAEAGIIPACAGNTGSSLVRWVRSSGSSPRVRGTLRDGLGSCLHAGIIPACAGNTRTPRGFRTGRRDHPRVCGEHSPHDLPGAPHQGSSPRVRGTRPHRPRWHSGQGIIPACAGNTWTEGLRPGDAGDHPRVCGEHAPPLACLFDARGSSPRVRGTLRRRRRARAEIGIIPACAGNTP